MLSGLRDRFFSSSIRSSPSTNDEILDAGARRLDKQQNDWRIMRDLCESSAKEAERVDAAIDFLVQYCDRHRDLVSSMTAQLASLPSLKSAVRQLTARLETLESSFADTERLLLAYEDTIEVHRLQARQVDERIRLAQYKERKLALLETVRDELVAEREARRNAVEARRCSVLRERQQTFGKAFEEEMQEYKQNGRVGSERIQRISVGGDGVSDKNGESSQLQVKLEDVEIDNDDTLDEFLSTVDLTSADQNELDLVDDESSGAETEDNDLTSSTELPATIKVTDSSAATCVFGT